MHVLLRPFQLHTFGFKYHSILHECQYILFNIFQKLAIYDRFGRIMYGSENLIKDVLEYVIFEKHIVNEYGRWRVHGKIIPTWLPEREPLITTIRKPKDPNEPTKPPESGLVVKKETKIEEKGVGGQGSGGPQLATA